jgi:8-oxo-dGTP pyrophosphatase MutT (NUDIX family)
VALVNHIKLGSWFPPGGHVGDEDPYETPLQALAREVFEETGLAACGDYVLFKFRAYQQLLGAAAKASEFDPHNAETLLQPWAVSIHDYPLPPGSPKHKHLVFNYLLKALRADLRLEQKSHRAIEWFSHCGLDLELFGIYPQVKLYGHAAIDFYYA